MQSRYCYYRCACSFHAIGAYYESRAEPSWLQDDTANFVAAGVPLNVRCVRALYWALFTLSTVCYGDVVPTNDGEVAVALAVISLGALVFSALIGSMTFVLAAQDRAYAEIELRMESLNLYLRTHPVPSGLHDRLARYYKYTWQHFGGNNQASFFNTTAELPSSLRQEVALRMPSPGIMHRRTPGG